VVVVVLAVAVMVVVVVVVMVVMVVVVVVAAAAAAVVVAVLVMYENVMIRLVFRCVAPRHGASSGCGWRRLPADMEGSCLCAGCPRRNVPDFGRVFLMLKYTDITQNTYIQS
jgi:hypothetical protein